MATNDLTFRLVTSSKGTNKLSHDGNLYIIHRGIIKKEWICEIRSCKARVHSVDDLIVKMSGEHFHSKENGKEEVAIAKENLRKRARETHDNPHIAIGEETSSLSEAAKSLLPSQHALKLMYKRQRTAPPIPHSVEDLELNASDIQTLSNKNFLFYDSGPDPERIVMFATRENLDFLAMSSIWVADGTFKTVPTLFTQLYTIHCLAGGPNPFANGHLLPCVYALLPNKKPLRTLKCGKLLTKLVQILNLTFLFVDFEQAVINSFQSIWPLTQVKACFFHLSQAVFRKIQSLGLQQQYQKNPEFAVTMRMLPALARLYHLNCLDGRLVIL